MNSYSICCCINLFVLLKPHSQIVQCNSLNKLKSFHFNLAAQKNQCIFYVNSPQKFPLFVRCFVPPLLCVYEQPAIHLKRRPDFYFTERPLHHSMIWPFHCVFWLCVFLVISSNCTMSVRCLTRVEWFIGSSRMLLVFESFFGSCKYSVIKWV